MKKNIVLLMLTILPVFAFTQEKLSKLQAPSSPAAGILGIQPSAVLTPKSYEALETALYSNIQSGNGGFSLPTNFGIEFSPYWASDHGLSLDDYLYPKSGTDQIVRNSSFSVASTQKYILGDSSETNGLAFGYRTTFYIGGGNDRKKIASLMEAMDTDDEITGTISSKLFSHLLNVDSKTDSIVQSDIFDFIYPILNKELIKHGITEIDANKFIKELKDKSVEKLAKGIKNDNEEIKNFHNDFMNILENKLNSESYYLDFKKYIENRQGFSVDIAYALLINFPTNNFETAYVPKQSLWLVPTYTFSMNMDKGNPWALKLMAILRYQWYNLDYYKQYFADNETFSNNFDYGIAIETQFNKFSLQFELIGQSSSSLIPAGKDDDGNELYKRDSKSDVQYLGSFNYNLTKQAVISYSLGNRFEPIANPNNTLVSTLTLNLGFGSPTTDDIDLLKYPK